MRMLILSAGVAALALAAPASAKPERGGHGNHEQAQKRGGGGKAKAQRGGGSRQQAHAKRGGGNRQAHVERRGGGQRHAVVERRGGGQKAQRAERQGGERRQAAERRGNQQRFANFQSDRGQGKAKRVEHRSNQKRDVARVEHRGQGKNRIENRRDEQRVVMDRRERRSDRAFREARRDRDNFDRVRAFDDSPRVALRSRDDFRRVAQWRDWDDGDWNRRYAFRGIPAAYVGCPPGLAKKSPACVPPGHARSTFVGRVLPTYYSSNYIPRTLRYIYADTPDYYYRWGDGYAYRVNRTNNLIAALLPLIGAGYGVGSYFPYYNQPAYFVPSYYEPFYPSYGDDYYRYANGYVYEIDGRSGLIEDVIPLLDRGYGIGQLMPAGYSYYNVPYQYRSLYYDTPDYYYRYAPGAIYQVDRDTRLITSIASLLTGGLAVGQPLPMGYSAYNVPLGYRDMYYDRPDAWYRYSDGYIYQVDPTTQLITAIVRAIV